MIKKWFTIFNPFPDLNLDQITGHKSGCQRFHKQDIELKLSKIFHGFQPQLGEKFESTIAEEKKP